MSDDPKSTATFMICTKCLRVGTTWTVNNEAYSCPVDGMDESGLEVINPQDLLETWWWTQRRNKVQLVEWYGENNFRARDERGVFMTVSILSLRVVDDLTDPAVAAHR